MNQSKLSLAQTEDGIEVSQEEFAEADYQKPWRYERANGRLVVMTPAGYDHHATAEPFRNHLGTYKLAHPDRIEHVFQEAWTSVDDDTDRLPDIAVYLTGGSGRLPKRIPDLIFEIVSQTARDRRRDYEEKRTEYERIGVREYIIVDRFQHTLTVLSLVKDSYKQNVLGPNDLYTTPLLPGLEIPLVNVI